MFIIIPPVYNTPTLTPVVYTLPGNYPFTQQDLLDELKKCRNAKPTIIKHDKSLVKMSKRQWLRVLRKKYKQLQDLKGTY